MDPGPSGCTPMPPEMALVLPQLELEKIRRPIRPITFLLRVSLPKSVACKKDDNDAGASIRQVIRTVSKSTEK